MASQSRGRSADPSSEHSQHPTGISRQASRRVVLEATDPRGLFETLVFENAEICSNCYARIRDAEQIDHDSWGSGNRPSEVRTRVADGTVGYDCDEFDSYGALRSYHTTTACGVCGQIGGRASDEVLSKQRAISRLPKLIRRLHEQRLATDVDRMYRTVGHLKSQPEHRGKDTEIFAAAVWLGLRRAADLE